MGVFLRVRGFYDIFVALGVGSTGVALGILLKFFEFKG